MKPKCLGNSAQPKYDVRNEERSQGPVLRAVVVSCRNRPRIMVGRMKYKA